MAKQKCILVVDDEEENRKLLMAMLESFGHISETAKDGLEALAKLKLGIDLVLLDVRMPGMDGFEVVRRIRGDTEAHDIPIIMVTGLAGKEERLRAVEVGVNDFISKPVDITELRVRTASLLKMKEAQDAIKHHQAMLEETVQKRTADLRKALEEMVEAQRRTYEAQLDTIQRLALAAEYKDKETLFHIRRISCYCSLLGQKMHLSPDQVEVLQMASSMHDVGKIGIPDAILLKPDDLTPDERNIIKQHTVIGGRILSGSQSELLQAGEIIALSHHEKWDGNGYPRGLSGKDIPLYGRICALADVFDALTNERPYKKAFSNNKAIEIMNAARGRYFDPEIFDLFTGNFDEVVAIQKKFAVE